MSGHSWQNKYVCMCMWIRLANPKFFGFYLLICKNASTDTHIDTHTPEHTYTVAYVKEISKQVCCDSCLSMPTKNILLILTPIRVSICCTKCERHVRRDNWSPVCTLYSCSRVTDTQQGTHTHMHTNVSIQIVVYSDECSNKCLESEMKGLKSGIFFIDSIFLIL